MPGRYRSRLPYYTVVFAQTAVARQIDLEQVPRRHLEDEWLSEDIEEYQHLCDLIALEVEADEDRLFHERMHAVGAPCLPHRRNP